MTNKVLADALDRLLVPLEDELLAVADRDLLADDQDRAFGAATRAVVADVLARRARRRSRPGLPLRSGPFMDRRTSVRQLLVASPRAREIAGGTGPESMSDEELDAVVARLVAAGLLPTAGEEE